MAGGMYSTRKSGPGVPLFLRGPHTPPADTPPARPVSRRHCWVHSPNGQLYAGLILSWRRDQTSWTAHVTYLDNDRAITQWVPADHLSPASEHS